MHIDENFCPSSLKSPSIGCLVCHKVSKAITDTESGEIICSGCGVVFTKYSEEHHDGLLQRVGRNFVISEFGFFGSGSQVATILYIVKKRTNLSTRRTS